MIRGFFVYVAVVALWLTVVSAAVAQTAPATTQPSDATSSIVIPASVAAFYVTDLFAKDSGYLSEVKADIGDHVRKGDVVAVIDDPELQDQLAGLEAQLAAKEEQAKAAEAGVQQVRALVDVAQRQLAALQAERDLSQATLVRQEQLYKERAATTQQIDEMRAKSKVSVAAADVGQAKIASAQADLHAAEAAHAVAQAQVRVTSADLARTRTLLTYTKVTAPFDGVITRRMVSPGDLVQAATTNRTAPLFTCQKMDVVRIFCDVPETSVAAVRVGLKAQVRMNTTDAKPIEASVTRVSGAMDPSTRTMRVEIDLPNKDEALRPGMYVQVTLTPSAAAGVVEAELRK